MLNFFVNSTLLFYIYSTLYTLTLSNRIMGTKNKLWNNAVQFLCLCIKKKSGQYFFWWLATPAQLNTTGKWPPIQAQATLLPQMETFPMPDQNSRTWTINMSRWYTTLLYNKVSFPTLAGGTLKTDLMGRCRYSQYLCVMCVWHIANVVSRALEL